MGRPAASIGGSRPAGLRRAVPEGQANLGFDLVDADLLAFEAEFIDRHVGLRGEDLLDPAPDVGVAPLHRHDHLQGIRLRIGIVATQVLGACGQQAMAAAASRMALMLGST
jgi:hypothetical protein